MKWIIAAMLVLTTHQAWSVEVKKIELFITSNMPVHNQRFARDIEYEVIYVDEVDRLESSISQQLPKDPQHAKSIAQKLVNEPSFTSAIGKAYQGQLKAWRYGVKHLPAAVINDGQGLIYGSSDVAAILTRAEQQ